MKNLIRLETEVIVGKLMIIHAAVTLASFGLSLIVWEMVGGSTGAHIAWSIVAWVPLISFMKISKKIEKKAVAFVQSRIPNDIELCSEKELITQLAVRSNGCIGILIKDGRPWTFERFEDESDRKLAANIALGWVVQVQSGIEAKRNKKS